jgi:hypothetical protein
VPSNDSEVWSIRSYSNNHDPRSKWNYDVVCHAAAAPKGLPRGAASAESKPVRVGNAPRLAIGAEGLLNATYGGRASQNMDRREQSEALVFRT